MVRLLSRQHRADGGQLRPMKKFACRVFSIVMAAGVSACAWGADLTVSAAASLTNAFQQLGPLFEASHPGTKVLFNFGASGALLQQLSRGAPVDVLATADQHTMDQAQSRGLVEAGARRNFVSNALVVIVPTATRQSPRALADLVHPGYKRITIGLPASVPVGRYTKAVLEQAGLWAAIKPKMIGAQSVRQALDYAARGEVDAAFVYATDAAIVNDKVKVTLVVPTQMPVLYPIAATASSANPAAAAAFVRFVESPPAQAVLGKFGFGKP